MSVTSTVRIPGAARRLKGSDKVAALLLAMGKPVAGRLLKHFDPLELRQITKSASGLGAVPTPVLEALEKFREDRGVGQIPEIFDGDEFHGPARTSAPTHQQGYAEGTGMPRRLRRWT